MNFQVLNAVCSVSNITKVKCEIGDLSCECVTSPMESEAVYLMKVTSNLFQEGASDGKLRHLRDELLSCQELNELEPGNKCESICVKASKDNSFNIVFMTLCKS